MKSKIRAKRDWSRMGSSYVMGLLEHPDSYMSIIDVWLAMTKRPPLKDFQENSRIRAGKYLEAAIIRWFEDDFAMQEPFIQNFTIPSIKNEYLCSTPDGIIMNSENKISQVLEVKNVGLDRRYTWHYGVPDIYFTQVQWHLKMVNEWNKYYGFENVETCHLRALFGGNEPADYEIKYDELFIRDLTAVAENFINEYVIPDKEPPPDASKDYSKYLSLTYPLVPDKATKKEASVETSELIREWTALNFQVKDLEEQIQRIKNQVEVEIVKNEVYGYNALEASVIRYEVKGRFDPYKAIKFLKETDPNLIEKIIQMEDDEKFKTEPYHVLRLIPKKPD